MGKRAVIGVDVQNDFLPGGALGVANGDMVIPLIVAASREADRFIVTRDWHPMNHRSFTENGGIWPTHCVQGTPGAEIDPQLLIIAEAVITKGADADKEAYSGFDGVDLMSKMSLDQALSHWEIEEVTITGLALDYCVRATALDAVELGYKTRVLLDATRPVAYLTGVAAILELQQKGVKVDLEDRMRATTPTN